MTGTVLGFFFPSLQNKELKSRLASSEGLQKPSGNVSQLEARVEELQDRLQAEERYRPWRPPPRGVLSASPGAGPACPRRVAWP